MAQASDEALEAKEMCPPPENAPALVALPERAEATIHPRRYEIDYFLPSNGNQLAVARHAAGKRPQQAFQV